MARDDANAGTPRTGRRGPLRIVAVLVLAAAGAVASAHADDAPATAGQAPAPAPAGPSGPSAAPGDAPAPAPGMAPPAARTGLAPRSAGPSFNNDYALLLGVQYWDRLDDFDPAIPPGATGRAGRFEAGGVNVEGSYHRRVTRWLGWDVLLGGDAGFFYHANREDYDVTIMPSGTRLHGELSARGLYLTPSVKLFSGEPRPWRFSVGAGAGYVLVDISNNLEDGMTVDTYFREETLGGYLSAGADRILSRSSMSVLLRMEAKVLFVDFGSLGGFAPGAANLTGPVFLFQAGVAVAD